MTEGTYFLQKKKNLILSNGRVITQLFILIKLLTRLL